LIIGNRFGNANNFTGSIDEVRVYNRALSQSELFYIYQNGVGNHTRTGAEEVGSSPTSTTLTINGGVGNITHQYTTMADNITAYVNVTGLPVNITVNGTQIANGITSATNQYIFPAGYWNVTAYYIGNGTYTASSAVIWANITQASSSCTLNNNPASPITYANQSNASCSCTNPEASSNLYRNGTLANSENNVFITLGVATHNYICNVTSTGNYTSATTNSNYVVNKGTPNINITLNTSSTISSGTPALITCNKPAELASILYNDTINITNPYVYDTTGKIGVFNFTCNTTGNTNYTAAANNKTLTITSASGLTVNVFDEENTTKALTFNITVNNGTASDTAYNQNNPYVNTSITGAVTIDITSTGYQQRTYYTTLTAGVATTVNASLLLTASGSWVIFYVYTPTELPIQNAMINVERLIPPASWLTVAQKKTDSSGSAATFLSPITTYRLNFSAIGYTNQSLQLMPAASPYVIYMMPTSALNISYNTSYKNLVIWIEPNGTALYQNTTNAFKYYILSSDNQLEFEGWRLTYSNGSQILFQNTTNSGGVTYTTNIDTTIYSTGYIDLNYWFKKTDFALVNDTHRYYIYGVHAYNTSIMAEVNDIAAGVAAGTPDVTMEQFAFISMLISIVCMAAASSQMKMFGSGVIGLMILSMLTFIGTYIWGSAYIVGWALVGLFALGVVAAIYIRGGFG
jgi:hypothetical protein